MPKTKPIGDDQQWKLEAGQEILDLQETVKRLEDTVASLLRGK